jgi:fibronectin-binding autotransporter adhesin
MKIKLFAFCFLLASFSIFAADKSLSLLDFSVTQNGTKTDIKWTINAEPVGAYFTIEKSRDGKDFSKVIDMPVGGNGAKYGEYFETDYQPYKGISYYRLKQIDDDGNAYYSDLVTMKFNDEQNQLAHGVIPINNPKLTEDPENNELVFVLRDMDGNDFYSKTVMGKEDNYMFAMRTSTNIPSGIYRIVGASNDKLYGQKLIIK